jgi:hypothetical protein
MRRSIRRAPLFFPLMLVLIGLLILLDNFLLLSDFSIPVINTEVINLLPLVLVIIGLQVLWRGDLAPSWEAQSFGITRGSVESASLEISSAEIDVHIIPLQRAGRLIAGHYTARSRPKLTVRNNHATLTMRRGDTWWFSMADWDIELAQDLPWSLLMSAHIGEIHADLRSMVIQQAHIATGIGDIKLISPDRETGPIYVRSTFGDIHLAVPQHVPTLVRTQVSPMVRIITNDFPFVLDKSGKVYATPAYTAHQPAITIMVVSTFGNILLSMVE